MFSSGSNLKSVIGDFQIDNMMRYSLFVPRLYNLCKSLGFEPGKIMPSRAFCSDESQGFPIILITKQLAPSPLITVASAALSQQIAMCHTPIMVRIWSSFMPVTSVMTLIPGHLVTIDDCKQTQAT